MLRASKTPYLGGTYRPAVSTSSANIATDVNTAITQANAAGGGVLELPAGTYNAAGIIMLSNVWLRGQGAGITILKLPANTVYTDDSNVIFVKAASADKSSIRISDLSIDGNRANQNRMQALTISALSRTGGVATATVASTATLTSNTLVYVTGASPSAYNGGVTVTVTSSTTFTYPVAAGTDSATGTIYATTNDNGYNGICLRGSNTVSNYKVTNWSIENVDIYGCGYHGIAVYGGCENFKISDSYFHGNGFRPVHVHGTDGYPCTDYQISQNRATANGVDTTTTLNAGGMLSGIFVSLNSDSRASVLGNTIWNEPGYGLNISGYTSPDTTTSEHNVFTGNTVSDCGECILFSGAPQNIIFSSNTVRLAQTSGKAASATGIGMHFSSAGTLGALGMIVSNNVITDCTSWGIASDTSSNGWKRIVLNGNVVTGCGTNAGANTGGIALNSFNTTSFVGNVVYGNNAGSGAPRQVYLTNTTDTVLVGNSIDSGSANFPALDCASSCSNILVTNNYVNRNSGSGTAITFAAANSFCFNNILEGSNTVNNTGTGNTNALFPISTTGAVTPTLGTNAPTGVTTPQVWLPVNVAGTTRYIPAW